MYMYTIVYVNKENARRTLIYFKLNLTRKVLRTLVCSKKINLICFFIFFSSTVFGVDKNEVRVDLGSKFICNESLLMMQIHLPWISF